MSEIETFFGSDHELTLKKAPYKVGGVEKYMTKQQLFLLRPRTDPQKSSL